MVFESNVENTSNEILGIRKSYSDYSVYSSGVATHDYTYECCYESYIQNKINNEQRLAYMINSTLALTNESAIMLEAKVGDKIKSGWTKLIEFIKKVGAKFMESLSNILLNQKDYLEKYKDIILNKKPKDDLNFSYTGNYDEAADRLVNKELPVFNYATHKKALEAEGDKEIAEQIINDSAKFTYDENETLADQFKVYFMGGDDQKEGKFSDLNFTTMYNFCYNFEKIKASTDKDTKHLEQSKTAIDNAIDSEFKNAGVAEAAAYGQRNRSYVQEGPNDETNAEKTSEEKKSSDNDGNEKKKDGVTITSTKDPSKAINSYGDRRNDNLTKDQAKDAIDGAANDYKDEKNSDAINKVKDMVDKFTEVCRTFITAKYTACEKISQQMMEIIRAHVRSYGGKDLKDKSTNTGKKDGKEYSKGQPQQTEEPKEEEPKRNSVTAERIKSRFQKSGENNNQED